VDAAEALRRADVAMYVAKGSRHSSFAIYSPDMDETLKIRRTISAELDAALSRGELQLVYQPLVCARTGKLVSAEALMRWPGKSGQAGSPGIFIPIAEETGLITRLGDWALDEAVSEIKRQKNLPIAVNVSPVQFRGDKFAESVSAAIARHGVDASLLRVEITEGVLISHTEEAYRTMRQLREMGVQVLLDDFGTGYSSLSYLHKFEFDGLKIDRAFLQQLNDPRTGINLLKSIIALGHSLNMKVIAEGVETEEQAAILQLLACDQLQGYALGRPDRPEKLAGTPTASVLQRAAARRAN
jgi:EAL domain-containing protein (putative c-di-GMP-specific phosphodiesterase class I)